MGRIRIDDTLRCFGLLITSLVLLPLSILVASLSSLVHAYGPLPSPHTQPPKNDSHTEDERKMILVTGVGMAKGLTLARAFHLSGHRVIGADFESRLIPNSGRYSKSLSAFYRLPKPNADFAPDARVYVRKLADIVKSEGVDLWVSCSGVANAVDDAEAKEEIERETRCRCIQFDVPTTSALHEKDSFMRVCKERQLPVPETHDLKSVGDTLRILETATSKNEGRKFILKPVGVDDANRGNMTLLPLSSVSETREHVSRLPITASNPWILQQFIPGGEEYCTHALVVRGQVKCFLACPSTELLMHYKALPPSSALWKAMLDFTTKFVQRSPDPEALTGHLSFDFMVDEGVGDESRIERHIYAIECNPRAHTAVVLFAQAGREMSAMVQAYLSATKNSQEKARNSTSRSDDLRSVAEPLIIPPKDALPRYWIGHDLTSLFIHPILRTSLGAINGDLRRLIDDASLTFWSHVMTWKEGTFEAWDPVPALVLYHVYWPLTILNAWWHGQRWSRVNVSTTKMFAC